MASAPIGEIPVIITGDYSALQAAIDEATRRAEDGAGKIADAFNIPAVGDAATQSIQQLGDAATTAGEQIGGLSAGSETAQNSLQGVVEAAGLTVSELGEVENSAGGAGSGMESFAGSTAGAASTANEATEGLRGMAEQLVAVAEALAITEGLKEFGQEALQLYSNVQNAAISLTALTGSATQAEDIISRMKDMAATQPFSFPELAPTVQRMVAMGVSAEQIPKALQAVGEAASATGNDLATVANMFDRAIISGQITSRGLMTLAISTEDLGKVMGITADQVKKAFAAMDETQRIDVLSQALDKFGGTSEALAKGIGGQWIIFKNQFEEVMEAVGQALAPVVSEILSGLQDKVIPVIKSALEQFNALPGPVKEAAVAFGIAVAALAPLTAGLGALGLAVVGLQAIIPAATGAMQAMGLAAGTTAAEEAAAATATTAMGAAATTAEAGVGALSVGLSLLLPAVIAVGGAFLATQRDIVALDEKAKEHEAELIRLAVAHGKTAEDLQKMGVTSGQLKDVITGLNTQLDKTVQFSTDAGVKIELLTESAEDAAKAHAALVQELNREISALVQLKADTKATYDDVQAEQEKVDATAKKLGLTHQELAAKIRDAALALKNLDQYAVDYAPHATELQKAVAEIAEAHGKESDALKQAIAVYAMYLTGTVPGVISTADEIAASYKKVDEAAKKLGVSHTDLTAQVNQAVAAIANEDVVVVNGASILLDHGKAAQEAADKHNRLVNVWNDATGQASALTDQVRVLTGAANDDANSASDLSDHWILTGTTWTNAADAAKSLADTMTGLTSDVEADTKAVEDNTSAWDDNATAQDKAKGSGSSHGGAAGLPNDMGPSNPFSPFARSPWVTGLTGQGGSNTSAPFIFGEGGLVTSATLGIVGEDGPEAVVPLDKLDQAARWFTRSSPNVAPLDSLPGFLGADVNPAGVSSTLNGAPVSQAALQQAIAAMLPVSSGSRAQGAVTSSVGAYVAPAGTDTTYTINGVPVSPAVVQQIADRLLPSGSLSSTSGPSASTFSLSGMGLDPSILPFLSSGSRLTNDAPAYVAPSGPAGMSLGPTPIYNGPGTVGAGGFGGNINITITGPVYGQQAAQMIGNELVNALRTVPGLLRVG